MSVKHGLLALLCEGPRYGYELKSSFEARTGSTWPLNVGQVYTTLARLERDGLVEQGRLGRRGPRAIPHHRARAARARDVVGHRGRARGPAARRARHQARARRSTLPGVDPRDVLQRQRTATVRALQSHTRKKSALPAGDTAAALVLDALVFAAEAEVRWLDHCEARARVRPRPPRTEPAR